MGQGVLLFQVICVWFPRDSLEMGPRAGARGTKGKKEKTLGPQTSYSIRNAQLHNDFWPPLLGTPLPSPSVRGEGRVRGLSSSLKVRCAVKRDWLLPLPPPGLQGVQAGDLRS